MYNLFKIWYFWPPLVYSDWKKGLFGSTHWNATQTNKLTEANMLVAKTDNVLKVIA